MSVPNDVKRQRAEAFWKEINGLAPDFPVSLNVENREIDAIEKALDKYALATDYSAERQRREEAEAGNAELIDIAKRFVLVMNTYDKKYLAPDDLQLVLDAENAVAQPHPGSRFLEMARIVEGLPKYEMVTVEFYQGLYRVVGTRRNAAYTLWSSEEKKEADALAALLQWRQRKINGY